MEPVFALTVGRGLQGARPGVRGGDGRAPGLRRRVGEAPQAQPGGPFPQLLLEPGRVPAGQAAGSGPMDQPVPRRPRRLDHVRLGGEDAVWRASRRAGMAAGRRGRAGRAASGRRGDDADKACHRRRRSAPGTAGHDPADRLGRGDLPAVRRGPSTLERAGSLGSDGRGRELTARRGVRAERRLRPGGPSPAGP